MLRVQFAPSPTSTVSGPYGAPPLSSVPSEQLIAQLISTGCKPAEQVISDGTDCGGGDRGGAGGAGGDSGGVGGVGGCGGIGGDGGDGGDNGDGGCGGGGG